MGLAAASLLAALLLPSQQRPTFEGHYVTGLETSAFTPCDSAYADERWWITADSAAWATLQRGAGTTAPETGEFRRSYLKVRGGLSDTGSYGHLGAYDRRLRVTEVTAVLPPDSAGCP